MGQNNENQIFMLCIENKDCEDLNGGRYIRYYLTVRLRKKDT